MDYDMVFIGGGPAGYAGGIAAAKKGLKTAVVEKEKLGGTCLHWGCIPTKALLHSVKLLKQLKTASKMGIRVSEPEIDIQEMLRYKTRVVSKLTRGIQHLFSQYGVDLIRGEGRVAAPGKIEVGGAREIHSKVIVISTGTRTAELPFLKFDNRRIIDSNRALELNDLPEKLLVVGAGAVGLELGTIYHYLGSEVTVVEIMGQVLPGADGEMAGILGNELSRQKINVLVSTTVSRPVIEEDGVRVLLTRGVEQWEERFSKILVSVGRVPEIHGVVDPDLNLKIDQKGFVVVNSNLQTSVDSLFACGDVVGPPLLAHRASHQAVSIVEFVVEKKDIRHSAVPSAVFTFPELASVGLTEEAARAGGMEVKVGRFPYAAGSRSNAIDDKRGMVKIISDRENRVLGAHIVGSEAGELMPVLTRAVDKKMAACELKDLIFIHPTLGENVWEALGTVGGFSIHI